MTEEMLIDLGGFVARVVIAVAVISAIYFPVSEWLIRRELRRREKRQS